MKQFSEGGRQEGSIGRDPSYGQDEFKMYNNIKKVDSKQLNSLEFYNNKFEN